jgi:hypothetical protein
MPLARKYVLKDLMPLQNNCLRTIFGAYRATPIRSLDVEVGASPLGINLDSIQAQFRARLKESEVVEVIRLAMGKVESLLRVAQGGSGRRRKNRTRGRKSGNFKRQKRRKHGEK